MYIVFAAAPIHLHTIYTSQFFTAITTVIELSYTKALVCTNQGIIVCLFMHR